MKLVDILGCLSKREVNNKSKILKEEHKNDILNYQSIIQNAVVRTNNICVQTYMLLKYYILEHYHKNIKIPKITKLLVQTIQRVSCITTNKGPKPLTDNKTLYNKILKIKEKISNFKLIDGNGLSQILDSQATQIITSYKNNITNHFLYEYINRFINSYFELNKKRKTNSLLAYDLSLLKNDVRNGTKECHHRYHKWLDMYRYCIVPSKFKTSYTYDIKHTPFKYLKHMLWMNEILELKGFKQFRVLPLRTDIILKYIEIDTKALVQIFKPLKQNDYYSDLTSQRDKIWRFYTYITRKKFKNYIFAYSIVTDGITCSVRYISPEALIKKDDADNKKRVGRKLPKEEKQKKREIKKEKEKKENYIEERELIANEEDVKNGKVFQVKKQTKEEINIKKKKEKYKEFKYIDEVKPNELLNHSNNVVFNDDGKGSLLMMKDKHGDFLNYTKREDLKNTKRLDYQKRIEKEKLKIFYIKGEETSIKNEETKLTDYNSKTVDLEQFIIYCSKKLDINNRISKEYEKSIYRRYKWYGKINRDRRDSKLANRIERTFGKDAIIITGDASVMPCMRHIISTPNKHLKRIIRNKTYQVDEYRTTCVNHKNGINYYKNNLRVRDKEGKKRSIHRVLTYQMENKRLGCINRDKNACYNMEIIYNHYLEYCRGNVQNPRPEIYCRDVKTPKIESSNQRSNRRTTRTIAEPIQVILN